MHKIHTRVCEGREQEGDIETPPVCLHDKLEPFAGCRLRLVEVEVRGWSRLVGSCS